MSIERIKHDDKMKKKEKRKGKKETFTGPECVWASDWDQLMLIGNNHYSMAHANRFFSVSVVGRAFHCTRLLWSKFFLCTFHLRKSQSESMWTLHQTSISNVRSKVKSGSSLVWDSIWHKTDSKTKMSVLRLMSKYCYDLKWHHESDCNNTQVNYSFFFASLRPLSHA